MLATKSRCPSSQATSPTKRHQPLISIFKFCAQRNYFKQRRNVSKLRNPATFLFLDPDLLPFLLKRLNIFKIAPWPAEKEFLKQVKFNYQNNENFLKALPHFPPVTRDKAILVNFGTNFGIVDHPNGFFFKGSVALEFLGSAFGFPFCSKCLSAGCSPLNRNISFMAHLLTFFRSNSCSLFAWFAEPWSSGCSPPHLDCGKAGAGWKQNLS